MAMYDDYMFQHTAARRRLVDGLICALEGYFVSTHSRPKAAGMTLLYGKEVNDVSTHSRPKAAGTRHIRCWRPLRQFQHTAARRRLAIFDCSYHSVSACFNTQPPEGGWAANAPSETANTRFQHTAA